MKAEILRGAIGERVTVFLDTAVFMYAGGADHPLRLRVGPSCASVDEGELDATTSVEVVQEILHRFLSHPPAADRDAAWRARSWTCSHRSFPSHMRVMRRVPELVARYPALSARDLLHVATCIGEGIDTIVSPDRGFDQVREIRRLDPTEVGLG